jgi:hypothetical protein
MTQKQAKWTVLALTLVLLLGQGGAADEKTSKPARNKAADVEQVIVNELVEIIAATDSPDTFALTVLALQQLGDKARPAVPTIIRNAERLKIFNTIQPAGNAYPMPGKKQQLAAAVGQGIMQLVDGAPRATCNTPQFLAPPTVSASYYAPVRTPEAVRAAKADEQLVKELVEIIATTDSLSTFALTVSALERVGDRARPAVPSVIRNAERLKVFSGTSALATPNGVPSKKQQVANMVAQAIVNLLQQDHPRWNAPVVRVQPVIRSSPPTPMNWTPPQQMPRAPVPPSLNVP